MQLAARIGYIFRLDPLAVLDHDDLELAILTASAVIIDRDARAARDAS